ncbi:hypothetical protein JWS13_03885 (plasmid) [Rhodococcus pseudokoreensis]|uniref:Peptidase family M48 n=1 Tax=Rhodococcus pseudokoreensis TaxID=2811421 RepID=A0A974VZS7_9NOCA|nr:hypothetical protein [Rhodococcus pseudokoreensis]QSE87813.1 hypothetical protein JWS13_03885 [Rhodococcus pseudokoreensis]
MDLLPDGRSRQVVGRPWRESIGMGDPSDMSAVDASGDPTLAAAEEAIRVTVRDLALRVGQSTIPNVVFDRQRALGLAAYHYKTDDLVLNPEVRGRSDFGVDWFVGYWFEGLILHELGHRAEATLLRARWWPVVGAGGLLVAAALVDLFWELPIVYVGFVIGLLLLLLGALAFIPLSWLCEFRADDFMCDHGGIVRAASCLDMIETQAQGGNDLLHPTHRLRFRRQIRRASLPQAGR